MVTKLSCGFQSEDIINSIHVMKRIIMLFFQSDCVRGFTFFFFFILFTIEESFSSLFGTIFIYGQRFLMPVVMLSPLYIITLLQFKNRYFAKKNSDNHFSFLQHAISRIFGNKLVAYTVEWTELFLLIPCQSSISDFAVKSAKRICRRNV